MPKATAPKYAVKKPFDRTEGAENLHFEPPADWPADHPDTPKYLEWDLIEQIVPAPAGSSQPGKTNEGAE